MLVRLTVRNRDSGETTEYTHDAPSYDDGKTFVDREVLVDGDMPANTVKLHYKVDRPEIIRD